MECKCLTVTKGKLIDYPIELPNLSINKDHDLNSTMTYSMLEEFPVCHCCTVVRYFLIHRRKIFYIGL